MKPDKLSTLPDNCQHFVTNLATICNKPWQNPNYPPSLPGSQPTVSGTVPKTDLRQVSEETSDKPMVRYPE